MSDVVIKVNNLGKRYRIGAQDIKPENIQQAIIKTLLSPFDYTRAILRKPTEAETLWALRDVSFEIKRGEFVGIIGHNGAGKSTLLQILSRITLPTEGSIDLRGRVSSLLEVGTGFHEELTGRENIYLNGAILGMRQTEIDQQLDEIIDFSGIEKFLDTPVKFYSSGMRVRLGFAVAAHLRPDILLIDEVLAVGDEAFRRKSFHKLNSAASQGRTILVVSHHLGHLTQLAKRAIWLDKGQLRMDGDIDDVIAKYVGSVYSSESGELSWEDGVSNPDIEEFKLLSIRIVDHKDEVVSVIDRSQPFKLEIEYEICEPLPHCRVGIIISDDAGVEILDSYDSDVQEYSGERVPGRYVGRCSIPGKFLKPGSYNISVNAGIWKVKNLIYLRNILTFTVRDLKPSAHLQAPRRGVIAPQLDWNIEAC